MWDLLRRCIYGELKIHGVGRAGCVLLEMKLRFIYGAAGSFRVCLAEWKSRGVTDMSWTMM